MSSMRSASSSTRISIGVELGAAALEVVDQAARRGDEDVGAATQVVDLRAHAGAAEDGGDVQAQVAAVGLDAVGDLHREFAGRRQDQRARLARAVGRRLLRQPLQQRQRERGGLAGAGLRAAEQVVPGQRQRNRLQLDRRGRGVAVFGERAQQRGRQPECFKRHVELRTPARTDNDVAGRGPAHEQCEASFTRSVP